METLGKKLTKAKKEKAPAKNSTKKVVKKAAVKKDEPDCDELAEAYKKRMAAVKKASGKKTQPKLVQPA